MLNETFTDYRTLACWTASRLLIEAAKTGESVDIALATGTVERVLRDRRLL